MRMHAKILANTYIYLDICTLQVYLQGYTTTTTESCNFFNRRNFSGIFYSFKELQVKKSSFKVKIRTPKGYESVFSKYKVHLNKYRFCYRKYPNVSLCMLSESCQS